MEPEMRVIRQWRLLPAGRRGGVMPGGNDKEQGRGRSELGLSLARQDADSGSGTRTCGFNAINGEMMARR